MSGLGLNVTPPRILKKYTKCLFSYILDQNWNTNMENLVLNGCSPLCVKLNLPATGHLTGTGFFAEIFNHFFYKSQQFYVMYI